MKKDSALVVNISLATVIKTSLFLMLLFLLYFFQSLVLSVLTAIVIASALNPVISRVEKWNVARVFAASIVYVLLLVGFIGLLFIFVPALLEQISSLYYAFPGQIDNLTKWLGTQAAGVGIWSEITNTIKNQLENFSLYSGSVDSGVLTQIIVKVFGTFFNFILIIVMSFYFAIQKHGIEIFLHIVTPPKYTKYAINLWKRSQKKIGLWMQGQLILGLLIGVITYLGLVVFFGFQQALLLAFLAAFAELIPLAGPIIAGIPAVAVGLEAGGLSMATGVLVFYLIVQMIENQLIYPLVVKKVVGVPSLLVIISLVVGAQLFGFLGVILAIPLSAVLMEFVKDIEKKQREALKKGEIKELKLSKK